MDSGTWFPGTQKCHACRTSSWPSVHSSPPTTLICDPAVNAQRPPLLTLQAVSNAEFQAQRDSRLAALPPASDSPTKEDEAAREAVLTQFYRDWQIGTRDRQRAWVRQWWSDVWRGIKTQARVYVGRWV